MNREIKFRFIYGIDGEENTYFSKVFTFGEIENGCHREELSDNPLYRNYSILAKHQFTGLLDEHGEEIYEGDLVKDYEHSDYFNEVIYDVSHRVCGFKLKSCIHGGIYCLNGSNSKYMVIIGNIYENPELLEGK